MRHRLLTAPRSILLGWATLAAVTHLVERPLFGWTAPLMGGPWIPTAQLALQCVALAAAGWMVGRWNRFSPVLPAMVFAATLAVWNFGLAPAINVEWLFRLTADSFRDARYLESWVTAAATHALLFGSLFTGVRLSRPAPAPVSLMDSRRPV